MLIYIYVNGIVTEIKLLKPVGGATPLSHDGVVPTRNGGSSSPPDDSSLCTKPRIPLFSV